MITAEHVTRALAVLDRCNLNAAKAGQAPVWTQIINEAMPSVTDDTLIAAVKAIAASRTSDGKGGSWVTVGDLIARMRAIRQVEVEVRDREQRQIESGRPSAGVDIRQLMADVHAGLSPEQIGERAKERAEAARAEA